MSSPCQLQQIVSHDDHRHFAQDARPEHLAPDAALHLGEGQRLAVLPWQHFAIDHHAFRQLRAQRFQLRKAVRHQLLAARPDERAARWRRINCARMPSHFHSTCHSRMSPRSFDRAFQRIGEEEWIRAADIGVARIGGHQLRPECGGGLPVAHQAMRDDRGVQAADRRDGAHHQALRHAHAKFAGDDLVPGEALALVHLAPRGNQRSALALVIGVAQRQQALLDPVVQGQVARRLRGRQQQRDGFGEIADGVVALAEEPFGDAGFLDGPLRQLARFQQTLGAAADQECGSPGGIGRRHARKVARERIDLLVGPGGFVEGGIQLGEGFHGSAPAGSAPVSSCSPSKRVSTAWASRPCCLSHSTTGARYP